MTTQRTKTKSPRRRKVRPALPVEVVESIEPVKPKKKSKATVTVTAEIDVEAIAYEVGSALSGFLISCFSEKK